jgi:hypothetical protein
VEGIFLVHVTCKTHFESQCQSLWTCESTKGYCCAPVTRTSFGTWVSRIHNSPSSRARHRGRICGSLGRNGTEHNQPRGFFIQLRSFRDVQDRHAAPAEYAEQLSRRSALSRLCPPPDEKLHAPTPPPTTKTTQHIRWATSLGELMGPTVLTNCSSRRAEGTPDPKSHTNIRGVGKGVAVRRTFLLDPFYESCWTRSTNRTCNDARPAHVAGLAVAADAFLVLLAAASRNVPGGGLPRLLVPSAAALRPRGTPPVSLLPAGASPSSRRRSWSSRGGCGAGRRLHHRAGGRRPRASC